MAEQLLWLPALFFLYAGVQGIRTGRAANGGYSPVDEETRCIRRDRNPVQFWLFSFVYIGIGLGCLGKLAIG